MKRRLFNLAAALSLLLSVAAGVAWAVSYAGTPAWRLIATAHSADLTRATSERGTLLFTTTTGWSPATNHGFWDAWWALNHRGRLSLLAQVIDYEGTLGRVYASPPSLTIDPPVEVPGQVVVFGQTTDSARRVSRFGFAARVDAQAADEVSARAWVVTLPHWFIIMLGAPVPLRWLRIARRRKQDDT